MKVHDGGLTGSETTARLEASAWGRSSKWRYGDGSPTRSRTGSPLAPERPQSPRSATPDIMSPLRALLLAAFASLHAACSAAQPLAASSSAAPHIGAADG